MSTACLHGYLADCKQQVLCKPMLPVVIQQSSKATDADDLIFTLALA